MYTSLIVPNMKKTHLDFVVGAKFVTENKFNPLL